MANLQKTNLHNNTRKKGLIEHSPSGACFPNYDLVKIKENSQSFPT